MKKIFFFLIPLLSVYSVKSQDTIVKKSGDVIIAKVLEIGPTEIKYKRFDFQDGPTYIEIKSNLDKIIYSNGVKEIFTSPSNPPTNQVIVNNNEPPRDYYNHNTNNNTHIEQYGIMYRYHNDRINERDLYDILYKTKDKNILNLVGKAKEAKALQFVGFFGIPLGIVSGFFFFKSTGAFYSYNNSYSNNNQYGLNNNDVAIGFVFLAGAITCPIISGVQKAKRNIYNHDAIKLYNEKY